MKKTCHYCLEQEDLRPYGPNGAMVCFECATATPERETAAKAAFSNALEKIASADRMVVITKSGLLPGPKTGKA